MLTLVLQSLNKHKAHSVVKKINNQDVFRHISICGDSGSGRTTTLNSLGIQALEQGAAIIALQASQAMIDAAATMHLPVSYLSIGADPHVLRAIDPFGESYWDGESDGLFFRALDDLPLAQTAPHLKSWFTSAFSCVSILRKRPDVMAMVQALFNLTDMRGLFVWATSHSGLAFLCELPEIRPDVKTSARDILSLTTYEQAKAYHLAAIDVVDAYLSWNEQRAFLSLRAILNSGGLFVFSCERSGGGALPPSQVDMVIRLMLSTIESRGSTRPVGIFADDYIFEDYADSLSGFMQCARRINAMMVYTMDDLPAPTHSQQGVISNTMNRIFTGNKLSRTGSMRLGLSAQQFTIANLNLSQDGITLV